MPHQGTPLTAVDLFSGLAGFSLAATACGFKILCQVERDPRCLEFLRKAWPDVPKHDDIKTFPAEQYAGATLVCGGPPCQPVSCAGKRRGEADDRYLWKETLSAIFRIRPAWCLLENPAGFRNMGLDGVLSELERHDYATRTFNIGACALGAPHRRMRYWIVCRRLDNSAKPGLEKRGMARQGEDAAKHSGAYPATSPDVESRLANATERDRAELAQPMQRRLSECSASGMGNTERISNGGRGRSKGQAAGTCGRDDRPMPWSNYVWLPCADGKVRRAPDDTQRMANGIPVELLEGLAEDIEAQLKNGDHFTPHRSILGALGNSIVWPVAAKIIGAMIESETKGL